MTDGRMRQHAIVGEALAGTLLRKFLARLEDWGDWGKHLSLLRYNFR